MAPIIKSTLFVLILALGNSAAFAKSKSGRAATPSTSSTPTANFLFDDHNGPADAGSYPAGASFTMSLNLNFAPGGSVTNLEGLSYWLEQANPLAPFYFSLTNRNVTGSQFTVLNTPGLSYPQAFNPSNANDLGAERSGFTGVGAGNYLIANLTIAISPSAAPGTYILENTTTGGKRSVITDDLGDTFNIPKTTYTVTVVPFQINSITQTQDGHIVLQCQGVPSANNRIEASSDLSVPNSFQTLTTVGADASGIFSFEDTAPGTKRFYRLAYP